jgi:hypothetical protein
VAAATRAAADQGKVHQQRAAAAERAAGMYKQKRYVEAASIVEAMAHSKHAHLEVLRAHCNLMVVLHAQEGPSEDTDWKLVLKELHNARDVVNNFANAILGSEMLIARYEQLRLVAERVLRIISDFGKGQALRIVDYLCGFGGNATIDARTALLLVLLRLEHARLMPGPTLSCQVVLSLPEQLFRIWSLWRLGLDYYSAPENKVEMWDEVEKMWPKHLGNLERTAGGQQFRSMRSFGYFSLALMLGQSPEHTATAPVKNVDEFDSAIGLYEQLRNSQAHSMCLLRRKDKERFFSLIDNWFDCALKACPESITQQELAGFLSPLPLIDANGRLI